LLGLMTKSITTIEAHDHSHGLNRFAVIRLPNDSMSIPVLLVAGSPSRFWIQASIVIPI